MGTRRWERRRRPSTLPADSRTHGDGVVAAAGDVQRLPSGANATPIGWLPSVAFGKRRHLHFRTRSDAVWTRETESEWPLVTASVFPSGLSATCEGARPTALRARPASSASTTLIVPDTRRSGHGIRDHRSAARRRHGVARLGPAPAAVADKNLSAGCGDAEGRDADSTSFTTSREVGVDHRQRVVAAEGHVGQSCRPRRMRCRRARGWPFSAMRAGVPGIPTFG